MGQTRLDQLNDADIRVRLERSFDLRLCESNQQSSHWAQVVSGERFECIAADATGSLFFLGDSSGRIAYVTSEGQAGVVAASLEEFLSLLLAHPYWRDLLKFSGGGQIAEMRRAVPLLRAELAQFAPELEADKHFLMSRLGLTLEADSLAHLHEAVRTGAHYVSVKAPDGTPFDSLFNKFRTEDNPAWWQ